MKEKVKFVSVKCICDDFCLFVSLFPLCVCVVALSPCTAVLGEAAAVVKRSHAAPTATPRADSEEICDVLAKVVPSARSVRRGLSVLYRRHRATTPATPSWRTSPSSTRQPSGTLTHCTVMYELLRFTVFLFMYSCVLKLLLHRGNLCSQPLCSMFCQIVDTSKRVSCGANSCRCRADGGVSAALSEEQGERASPYFEAGWGRCGVRY